MVYGVRFQVWGRNDRIQNREKLFETREKRDKYATRVEKQDNFYQFVAWLNEE